MPGKTLGGSGVSKSLRQRFSPRYRGVDVSISPAISMAFSQSKSVSERMSLSMSQIHSSRSHACFEPCRQR